MKFTEQMEAKYRADAEEYGFVIDPARIELGKALIESLPDDLWEPEVGCDPYQDFSAEWYCGDGCGVIASADAEHVHYSALFVDGQASGHYALGQPNELVDLVRKAEAFKAANVPTGKKSTE